LREEIVEAHLLGLQAVLDPRGPVRIGGERLADTAIAEADLLAGRHDARRAAIAGRHLDAALVDGQQGRLACGRTLKRVPSARRRPCTVSTTSGRAGCRPSGAVARWISPAYSLMRRKPAP
jgi:hypothetical protein